MLVGDIEGSVVGQNVSRILPALQLQQLYEEMRDASNFSRWVTVCWRVAQGDGDCSVSEDASFNKAFWIILACGINRTGTVAQCLWINLTMSTR